ncbi:hypothetical protein ACFSKL_07155 [Belliella marina]|uniref:Uncharacterized protein n=1 Tax=Belliella marina TaxID=1644146 RepID=A0ABW4VKB8_9BACT
MKNHDIGNSMLITHYSGFILSNILETEFSKRESKNEDGKSENFQLNNIQIIFFSDDKSALVYLGSINFQSMIDSISVETSEAAKIKYSDWDSVITEANIVVSYEYPDLNSVGKQIRTEVFKLKNREIVKTIQQPL